MCKVLLLDKDEVIRMLYRETLEEEGFSVVDTGRHEMFCEMIEEESPDIVVMGADQDPWASLNLLETIRRLYYDLPVILCTAYSHVRHDPKALAADYILVKGSGTGELLKSRIQKIQDAMIPIMKLGSTGTNGPWERESGNPAGMDLLIIVVLKKKDLNVDERRLSLILYSYDLAARTRGNLCPQNDPLETYHFHP